MDFLRRKLEALSNAQIGLLVILTMAVVISHTLFPMNVELRWFFYVNLLIVLAWVAVKLTFISSGSAPPLGLRSGAVATRSGELEDVVVTLERAERGMKYSQRRLLLRVRRAFLNKVAAHRGLDAAGLEALSANPSSLRNTVKDPLIIEFLQETTLRGASTGDGGGASQKLTRGQPLLKALDRVLKAMEAWD